MYERLKEKVKLERVIKITIANKLFKQAFAIGKSQMNYLENHVKIQQSTVNNQQSKINNQQ